MRRVFALPAAIVIPALVAGCGNDIAAPATGTIYGDLVYGDGQPAAGVEVIVEGEEMSVVSGADGRFVINGVLAVDETAMGRYYVVRGAGERAGTPVGFLVDHFKVKGQQSYGVGTVTVLPTGEIAGVLLSEGDTDHSGATVRIEGTSLETLTRADGAYRIERVPAFDGYHVGCTRPGYAGMVFDTMGMAGMEQAIHVEPGAVTVLPDDVLHPLP